MAAEQEALDVGALEEYMAEPTVLPAFYKKKDLLIYAVGIGERHTASQRQRQRQSHGPL